MLITHNGTVIKMASNIMLFEQKKTAKTQSGYKMYIPP